MSPALHLAGGGEQLGDRIVRVVEGAIGTGRVGHTPNGRAPGGMMWAVQPYFRDAVPGDLAAIATIVRAAAPHDPATQAATPESYRRSLAEIERLDGSYLLVAEYDNRLAAALHLMTFPTVHGAERVAQVIGLWVAEPFRTTGIDAMLLDHALERADDLDCTRIQVMANGAHRAERAFWERVGFVHLDAGYVRNGARAELRQIS